MRVNSGMKALTALSHSVRLPPVSPRPGFVPGTPGRQGGRLPGSSGGMRPSNGRGFAIAGLVMGYVVTFGWILLIVLMMMFAFTVPFMGM